MSIAQVAAALDTALAKIKTCVSRLHDATTLLDEAGTALGVLLASPQYEAQQAIGLLTEAAEGIVRLGQPLAELEALVASYRESLISQDVPRPATQAPPPSNQTASAPTVPLPPWCSQERVDQIRQSLPQGKPKTQTEGWWIGSNKARKRVLSGPDSDPTSTTQRAERYLRSTFPDDPGIWALSRHVEIKVAVEMMDRQPTDEVLVIDRAVCGRERGISATELARWNDERATCDQLLPFIIKKDASLTVVERDGRRVRYGREPS